MACHVIVSTPRSAAHLLTVQGLESSGAVYVFARAEDGEWLEQAKLTAAASAEQFGYSLALSGDLLVAGAPAAETGAGVATGAVYIFEKDSSSDWTQQARVTAADGAPNDWFGASSCALSNGWLVVGAPRYRVWGGVFMFLKNEVVSVTSRIWVQILNSAVPSSLIVKSEAKQLTCCLNSFTYCSLSFASMAPYAQHSTVSTRSVESKPTALKPI